MNTTDADFNPTPGPWTVRGSRGYWSVSTAPKTEELGGVVKTFDCELVSVLSECDPTEMQSNATLIAEAGTVFHETGKTPRRLADENAELLVALEDVMRFWMHDDEDVMPAAMFDGAWRAINKAKKEA